MTAIALREQVSEAFQRWCEELERFHDTDIHRTTICLLHLARLMEDSIYVPPIPEQGGLDEELVDIISHEAAEALYSCFRTMLVTPDIPFIKACLRLLIIFKQCASQDLGSTAFYECIPRDEIEDYLIEALDHPDELVQARIAFLYGGIGSDSDVSIDIHARTQTSITRLKVISERLIGAQEEMVQVVEQQIARFAYTTDLSKLISLPDQPIIAGMDNVWGVDEADVPGSTLYSITVAEGMLRLIGTLVDYTEALPAAINGKLVEECIRIMRLPCFGLQCTALTCVGNALIHRKLALEFVEQDGPQVLHDIAATYQHDEGNMQVLGSHMSHAHVMLSKHPLAMEAMVKPINAKLIVDFVIAFMTKSHSVETKLNVIEWCGEVSAHPLLLREIHRLDFFSLLSDNMKEALRLKQDDGDMVKGMALNFIRETTRTCLRYITVSLFWAVQYSKSLYPDPEEQKQHSSSSSSSAQPMLIRKNYIATSGSVDLIYALTGAPTLIRLDENEAINLETFVLKNLMKSGHLPKGMTLDLFGGSFYRHGSQHLFARSTTANDEFDNQSVASLVMKTIPEWTIAGAAIDHGIISLLLLTIIHDLKDSTTVNLALYCLQALCLDAAGIMEIMQFDFSSPQHQALLAIFPQSHEIHTFRNKKGLEILLTIISSEERRDPNILAGCIRLIGAMSASPYFRYNGTDMNLAQTFIREFQTSPANTIASKKVQESARKIQLVQKLAFTMLENIQKTVRKAIRAHAGINALVQMIYYKKNQSFVSVIRLETIKVLLGLQQDDEIKQILAKMRLPTLLENQIRTENSQSQVFDINNNMAQKKALLHYYTETLVRFLSGHSTEIATTIDQIDEAQETLMRKNIVDNSQIDFSDFELLYLIRDHLASIGLNRSAAVLESELLERDRSAYGHKFTALEESFSHLLHPHSQQQTESGKNDKEGEDMPPPVSSSSLWKTPLPSTKKRIREMTIEETDPTTANTADHIKDSSKKVVKRLSFEAPTDASAHIVSASSSSVSMPQRVARSPRDSVVKPHDNLSHSNSRGTTPMKSALPFSKSQRQRNVIKALHAPSNRDIILTASSTIQQEALPSPSYSHSVEKNKFRQSSNEHQSKLSTIMKRYLKLQHSHCRHPVTTLPVLSLQKPHVCRKPSPVMFNNITRIVNHYRPTIRQSAWIHASYHASAHTTHLQHVYSSYRQLENIKPDDNDDDETEITAFAFGKSPYKVWTAYYSENNGTEVTLLNMNTNEYEGEVDDIELEGFIDDLVFNDHQPLMISVFQPDDMIATPQHRLAKQLMLYRDRDDPEVFRSPALRSFRLDAASILSLRQQQSTMPMIDGNEIQDQDLTFFVDSEFSRNTGSHLTACYLNARLLPMAAAVVFDVETGAIVSTLANGDSTMTSTTYEAPKIRYLMHEDNSFLMDGKLFDIRQGSVIHRFDKLSSLGNTAIHPAGHDIIIDQAIWDLRTFSLRQTVPLLEDCRVLFDSFAGGIIAYNCALDEERDLQAIVQSGEAEDYQRFHVLNSNDYSHVHTQAVGRQGFLLSDIRLDRSNNGLIAGLMLGVDNYSGATQCRIWEIGKRKGGMDEDDDYDEDSEDMDDEDYQQHFNGMGADDGSSGSSGDEEEDDDDQMMIDMDGEDEDEDEDDEDEADDEAAADEAGDDEGEWESMDEGEEDVAEGDGEDEAAQDGEGWETVTEDGEEEG